MANEIYEDSTGTLYLDTKAANIEVRFYDDGEMTIELDCKHGRDLILATISAEQVAALKEWVDRKAAERLPTDK